MLVEVARTSDIAPGGMMAVETEGKELVLCNYHERIYAIDRRCGHENAPLDMGTLEGYILTCPLHHVQFDIRTGKALSPPVPRYFGDEPADDNFSRWFMRLAPHMKVCDLKTYAVKVDGNAIKVDI